MLLKSADVALACDASKNYIYATYYIPHVKCHVGAAKRALLLKSTDAATLFHNC